MSIHPLNNSIAPARRSGQALTEFVVGLVAMLALIACVSIGTSMIVGHSASMEAARKNAATAALTDTGNSEAQYTGSVTVGNDQKSYTRDDGRKYIDDGAFKSDVVDETVVNQDADTDWKVMDNVAKNPIETLKTGSAAALFGLVKGTDKRTIDIQSIPATRLFYDSNTLDVKSDVWMTQLNNIY